MKIKNKGKNIDFFENLESLANEEQVKSSKRKTKSALNKWGQDFDDEKFEPIPRIFLENLNVFKLKGSELPVLLQIFMWWTDRTRWPTCHYDAISARTGLSNRMIMDTLKRLEEKQIRVPDFKYEVIRNKSAIIHKEVKWAEKGIIKRLKYVELPPGMKTRSNNGARFFDLTNLIEVCTHLLKQKKEAQRGWESINKAGGTKSAEETVYDITHSKDFKKYTEFLRKHQ